MSETTTSQPVDTVAGTIQDVQNQPYSSDSYRGTFTVRNSRTFIHYISNNMGYAGVTNDKCKKLTSLKIIVRTMR